MKKTSLSTAILAFASLAGAASAQDVITTSGPNWRGFYAGGNLGGAWNSTCNSWTPNGGNGISNPAIATAFYNRNCPNNGTFVGGLHIGYNFQKDQLVWGFGLDYDFLSGKTHNRSFTYGGASPPPDGTYLFSGKTTPNGFAILGPRIGYAVDNWLPYFRIGGVFTSGTRRSTATFTDASGTASFTGGKNFNTSGFGVGVGVEYMLQDPWSVKAEYTHVSLGKGDNSVTSCSGTAATCATFGNISIANNHNSFTANVFRVGFNYRFNF
jgi:outer membrane immunogenic protein